MSHHVATLLLGSNLGETEKNLNEAIEYLESDVGEILKKSNMLYSAPVEFASNNFFCNIALLIKMQFSPLKLLNSIKKIEFVMGRKEDSLFTGGYVDRIIDIDIVKYDHLKFDCRRLKIPHNKHLFERKFSRELLISLDKH